MNTNLTEIVVVMDRSGSTRKTWDDGVCDAFNSFFDGQAECKGKSELTLVPFSSNSYNVCDGMLDTIIFAIEVVGRRLSDTPEDARPGKVVFVIVTNGDENVNKLQPTPTEYQVCKARVIHQTDVYGWEFIFLAANQDAVLIGEKIGIKAKCSKKYNPSKIGIMSAYQRASAAVKALRKDDGETTVATALLSVE